MIGSKDLLDMICTEAIENYERREDCGECAGSGTAVVSAADDPTVCALLARLAEAERDIVRLAAECDERFRFAWVLLSAAGGSIEVPSRVEFDTPPRDEMEITMMPSPYAQERAKTYAARRRAPDPAGPAPERSEP